jgi:hypothetical protein
MKSKNIAIVLLLVLILLSACGQKPAATEQPIAETDTPIPLPTNTQTPTQTLEPTLTFTPSPSPTPTLPFKVPEPKEGKGTIVGRVLWGGIPFSEAIVKLDSVCDKDICRKPKYSSGTNEYGYYMFSNVDPGKYVIVIYVSSDIVIWLHNGDLP